MVAIKRFFLYIFYYFNTSFNRKAIQLPTDEVTYIKAKVAQGWTPDTIMGRAERPLSCSMRTLYRLFVMCEPCR